MRSKCKRLRPTPAEPSHGDLAICGRQLLPVVGGGIEIGHHCVRIEARDRLDARVLIGEIYLPLQRLVTYYGNNLAGAQMPFNFALLSTLWSARSIDRFNLSDIFEYMSEENGRRLLEQQSCNEERVFWRNLPASALRRQR